jgi:hypothetical protein
MADLAASPEDFVEPETVIQIGFPPRRIDILTFSSGLEFEAAWENRVTLDLDGLRVDVLALDDLIANKKATGRPQDLVDISKIERDPSNTDS